MCHPAASRSVQVSEVCSISALSVLDEDFFGFGTILGDDCAITVLIIRYSIDLMWGAITVVVTVDLATRLEHSIICCAKANQGTHKGHPYK